MCVGREGGGREGGCGGGGFIVTLTHACVWSGRAATCNKLKKRVPKYPLINQTDWLDPLSLCLREPVPGDQAATPL